jgi:replication factor C subunit 2/4
LEVLRRLQHVIRAETLTCENGGLEALIFTAESDIRCALNNLQMTSAGFDKQLQKKTFKVYD